MQNSHTLDKRLKRCDRFGNKYNSSGKKCGITDSNYYYYIDHFYSKSTEEFIKKIIKGDCGFGINKKYRYPIIYLYFKFNKLTTEKFNYIFNKVDLNISNLKKKILQKAKKKKYLFL